MQSCSHTAINTCSLSISSNFTTNMPPIQIKQLITSPNKSYYLSDICLPVAALAVLKASFYKLSIYFAHTVE